jgi:3-hydroxy-9,10-secoandrosta-1,3,5(10)-triene-9,17-dione monooxygenase
MVDDHSMANGERFVKVAADLRPTLVERAAQCEDERRLPSETVADLLEAGLFHLRVPVEHGGHGCDIRTSVRVAAEVAKGCASTAWVMNLLNLGTGVAAGMLPPEGVAELFGSEELPMICGVHSLTGTATPAEGGYVVEGSWGFASGSLHSSWAMLGVRVLDAKGVQASTGLAWVPIAELTIKDTWHVAGMKGTGSNTLVVDHVFVPEYRIMLSPDEFARQLQHSPLAPAFAVFLLGPLLGATESILQGVLANGGRGGGHYFKWQRQSDSPVFLEAIGEAAMLIETAWLHTDRAVATLDNEALAGPMDYPTAARGQGDAACAVAALRRAASLLINVAGASAYAESSPLQRAWRDLEVGAHHAGLNIALSFELYGRVLAGEPSNNPFFGRDARVLS